MNRLKACLLFALLSICLLPVSFAGTINSEYSTNAYDKSYVVDWTLSVPTLNGVQLSKIKGVVVNSPGVGGSYAYRVNDRWAKFLYEHGLAYLGIGGNFFDADDVLGCLNSYASDNLDGTTYAELQNAPIFIYGESYGGAVSIEMPCVYPERVAAFVVEHSRNIFPIDAYTTDPATLEALQKVPGYYRYGEFDSERFADSYHLYSGSIHKDKRPHGMQIMALIEPRQVHANKRYAFEEAMGYFGLIYSMRYDYQEGVAGKDPSLGPVTLTELPYTEGYYGEHIIGGIQTDGEDPGSEVDDNYPNLMMDWEAKDPKIIPYADFDRENEVDHSWIPNPTLGAFWASKFAYGRHDLKTDFIDLLNDDFGGDATTTLYAVFPNYFLTGQDIRVSVSAWDFPNLEKVEFYANEQRVATVDYPPYTHTYNFALGEEGMYALYAVGVASDGQRTVGFRRMVQVYPNTRGANTAPTISNIGMVSGMPGETISVPFLVGDAETSADALSVSWQFMNRTNSIAANTYNVTTTGTTAERNLQITLPETSGILWGIVQVSDGDMSANAYVQINVTGDGSAPPFFVDDEAVVHAGPIYTANAWTRRISAHIYDFDTDVTDLTLTATSNNTVALPNENIRVGGAGRFRYVQIKPVSGGATVTLELSDGNTTVTKDFYVGLVSQDNELPRISKIPDQSAYYSNTIDPIEVRVYDLHTPSEKLKPTDTELALTVTSDNQTLIPDGSIQVDSVGARRYITFTPANGQTGTATLTATVTDEGGLTASDTFQVTVSAPPALAADAQTLYHATASQSYSAQLSATGGIEPYSWSLASGSLPTGLTLNADGSLSGTPTQIGTFNFTAQVQDADTTTDTESYTLVVEPYLVPPSNLTATSEADTTITLDWSDTAVGETGYEIQRRDYGDYAWSTLTTTAAGATTYNDSASLAFGQIYEYRLRAVGSIESAYTSEVSAAAVAMPVITTQPASVGVLPNHDAVFTVAADGGNLAYQWYEGNSGDTASPVSGATAATLSVANLLASHTYWVRVSNGAGQVDSVTATASVSMDAPSLKFNFGADAGNNWNSYSNFSVFAGSSTQTDNSLVYTTGSAAQGVSLTMTRSSTNEPFCDYFSSLPLAAYTGDWLNDAAATSAWGIGLEGNNIQFEVTGLPAGTYSIEAFVKASSTTASDNDASTYPAYKLDANTMTAGVSGSATTTTTDFDSALYDSEDHGTELLKWTNLTIADGETLEVTVSSSSDYMLINAFAIKGTQLAKPEIGTPPASQSINNGDSVELSVLAFGNGTLHYQWYQGSSGDTSTPVGTDSATFTTPSITLDTDYWVRVSDDNGSTDSATANLVVPDITAPAAITDLSLTEQASAMQLDWTAPGDDGNVRTATSYDIRYSTSPIANDTDFANAQQVTGEPVPSAPGSAETLTVIDLATDTTYYFAIKTSDEIPNVSALSNLPSASTPPFPATWEAWHNTQVEVVNPNDAVVSKGDTHNLPIALLNSQDGSELGATITYTYSTTNPDIIGYNENLNEVVNPVVNTDFYAFFDGKLNIDRHVTGYTSVTPAEIKFSNLPSGTYEIILATNRGTDDYNDIPIWIEDATGYSNVSSVDAIVDNNETFIDANNTYSGHVARWVNITPTGDGGTSFTIKSVWQSSPRLRVALPQAIILKRTAPTPAPLITEHPRSEQLYVSETATLSVSAQSRTAGGGTFSYQWYEGESGDMSTPIAGATASNYTTPALPTAGEYHYWVSVTDAHGVIASDTARLTVMPIPTTWTAYHTSYANEVPFYPESVSADHIDGESYALINYATTEELPATITFNTTGTFSYNVTNPKVAQTDAGTDAYDVFNNIIAFSSNLQTQSESATKSVEIVFDNLTSSHSYEVSIVLNNPNYTSIAVPSLNRYYGESLQNFTIQNATGYTNSSSATAVVDNDTTEFLSGNKTNGYLAKWTNITPTGNGGRSFSVTVTSADQYTFVPQLIKLEAVMSSPMIKAEPASGSIAPNDTYTMSVDAIASVVGGLSYQWYEGTSGDTSSPISGATSASYTTPALVTGGDHLYWVAVTDANGTSHSGTAIVTVDNTAPSAVSDLAIDFVHIESLNLSWTAPGDDAGIGTATTYDLRYSTSPIGNDTDFDNATPVTGEPVPSASGATETMEVMNLAENTTYYFALKTVDEIGNVSALSNVATATTRIYPTSWEAWHGTVPESIDPNESLTSEGYTFGEAIRLKDSANGSYLPATITFIYPFYYSGTIYDAVSPGVGTDFHTYFNGKLEIQKDIHLWVDRDIDRHLDVTFGNLRPGTYELIVCSNGQSGNETMLKLYDANGYTNESSAPTILDNDSMLMPEENTTTGYVGRWTGIVPTGDDGRSFTLRAEQYLTRESVYMPTAIILKYTGPSGGVPVIGSQPTGSAVDTGETATMSVNAAASAGQVTFQWYEGTSGDTASPISGATSATYTTPAYVSAGSYDYWVAVTDDNATVNSDTATVTVTDPDVTAPSAVADLASTATTVSSVSLQWTASGDDASTGTATSYDLRYSTSNIADDTDFDNATQVTGEPTPAVAGTTESMTITGLDPSTTYYFAIKTSDEESNVSSLSNIANETTLELDTTAPATVTDLSSSTQTTGSITLAWTAPGDDATTGTATSYDIRYSTSDITNDTDFNNATQATGEPSPSVAGTTESFTVSGLAEDTTYYFAIKTTDEQSNTSSLSNALTAATAAPMPPEKSLMFNFGSTVTGNWNNFVDNTILAAGTSKTGLTGFIYDDGSAATGITIDMDYSAGKNAVLPRGPMIYMHSDGWLTGDASQYGWYMNATGGVFKFRLNGLPEGEYQIEAYIYQDAGADYAFSGLNALAGIVGSTTTTSDAYSTAGFLAGSTGVSKDKIAKWSGITLSSGQVIEIEINGGGTENALINALRISKMQTAAPATTFDSWATTHGVTASNVEDPDSDGINNLLEYALDLDPNANESASGLPTVAPENDGGTDYLTLTYRKNLDAPDLTYTIETSTDLTTWSVATVESDTVITADLDGDGSSELRKARLVRSGEKQFLRIKVTQ